MIGTTYSVIQPDIYQTFKDGDDFEHIIDSSDEYYLIEEYEVRKEYQNLLNFNISILFNFISLLNFDFREFNEILIKNGVDYFLDFIHEKNIDKYINNWFKIINSNIKKLLNKQDNIIKEVIEDIDKLNNYTSEYPMTEKSILNYIEYLKENLKNDRP